MVQTSCAAAGLPGAAALVAFVWEGSKALFAIPDYKLPHLGQIAEAFVRPTPKGPTWQVLLYDAGYTLLEAVTGFVVGGLTGFLFAVLFVHLPVARRGLLPFVIASQTVPIIAIAPMIVVGLGQLGAPPWIPKASIAAYLTFFPVTINVLRGLEAVDRDALALMKSYAATSPANLYQAAAAQLRHPTCLRASRSRPPPA
ncbi:MAG: ABC transporter permease subunit [Ottowia sp.]